MPTETKITEFIEKGLSAGIPHDALVGVLAARGWPEREVYEALGEHYARAAGIAVPQRAGGGASAKEAFFYLLLFSTLATWTIGFGCLAFALIDRWLADPLFSAYQQAFDTYTIASSLAALLVAYPVYLLLARSVTGEVTARPERRHSAIRKWLTYMALVIAASIVIGDLIAALTYLLRGELTSRFVAKAFVVLALAGGVFSYYFGDLRRSEATPGRAGWDRLAARLCSAAVALALVLGFVQLGSPGAQRALRGDNERVQQLSRLSAAIGSYWNTHGAQLPGSLDAVAAGGYADPISGRAYEYHPGPGSKYELCATFARSSAARAAVPGQRRWEHPAGHHCFALDAAVAPPMVLPYGGE